jgi:hypothetical protein
MACPLLFGAVQVITTFGPDTDEAGATGVEGVVAHKIVTAELKAL